MRQYETFYYIYIYACICLTGNAYNDFVPGQAMYPVFLEPAGLCMDLGACTMKSLVQGTCEECTAGIVTISQMIGSEEVVVEIIDFLKVTKLKVLNI